MGTSRAPNPLVSCRDSAADPSASGILKFRRNGMNTIVSRTLTIDNQHEFLLKLETAGLDATLAQRVINSKDNELGNRIVAMIQIGDNSVGPSNKQSLTPIVSGICVP